MERQYFGTDGIRGRVGHHPMTPDFALRLGWAAGRVLAQDGKGLVLIGKDTRVSGYMFESAMEAGLSAAGVDIRLLGPMPTPAVAYLTRTFRASAGIVISASHNPYYDNGFKFFSTNGSKLPDAVEQAIEAELEKPMETVDSADLGKVERMVDAAGRYIEFCKGTIPTGTTLRGLRIVVDCAHGATYAVAPHVFEELGAEVIPVGVEPDGFNINEGCGSLHPKQLQTAVLFHQADLGIALDGDGDRLILVDEKGEVVDGDQALCIIALARHEDGILQGGVVGTLMSNLGLEQALSAKGIPFRRAAVGDRYVMEALQSEGWVLGGESSGHLICLDRSSSGDGILAALQILEVMRSSGRPLSALKAVMEKYPQTLVNVPINAAMPRATLLDHQEIAAALKAAESTLAGRGRVLLRPSGTEPLVRVMVEGSDMRLVGRIAQELAEVVRRAAETG
ncbi:phosphoglucosamine mutase [Ectothiorhodospira lacustris]|uniref:phosphoglucosamine mutase n=1 Tax=Ectothiorhodospira lacustris TaxID=2899127 RepID=UPI001EE7EAC7|nr:phosphoglucosamine mutase [Ectothiorhodospira lacustris]MCG5501545.1 phosphoglucosamine mutase [Ectothiorhodospira lacustris]MCG5508683.1 phosphoglucosamine mutase [Ectothiorhodospira lacustris]MCG5520474.1 phosphoglucosamine mutase [Ectothiorhodospira lacustris]